ncbi:DUF1156 domain-containing protein [Halomicroarcula sp. S3CR25-11]|uniref:DUF1156 domain-containing protein n=2 Tax=Haloarcula onubensis TaxID=2950539 RepID=A0ABU2FTE7_9EURY|nr:DUF1156 domain-containing protein [Halomicroarcula sp. S3CR25-11]
MDEFAERESHSRHHYRPIYSLHKWWARRPGTTFRTLGIAALSEDSTERDDILRRTSAGGLEGKFFEKEGGGLEKATILDPFMGGGTTIVESNRLNATTRGYELNPVAWWTTKKSVENVDLEKLESEFKAMVSDVREDIREYYLTTDPDTGDQEEIQYSLQSQRVPCLTCDEEVNLFKNYKLGHNKSTSTAGVYCPNLDCDSPVITFDRDIKDIETCPTCGTEFDPSDGNYGRGKYTCSKGHKHDVKETLDRLDKRPEFDYYAIKYKTSSGEEKFKHPDKQDLKLVKKTEEKYHSVKHDLPIPHQKIPEGDKTQALLNYNYEHFYELFTPRHRLTHGKLMKRAKQVDNQNISEFLITAVSNMLTMNGLLTLWDARRQYADWVFKRHAFIPRVQPVEANPLNERGGRTSIQNFFDRVYKAKDYCENPFEKSKNSNTGKTENIYIQNEKIDESRSESLQCKTAERMSEEDNSVDYVITDPPYYDNVQYSELSDYFYVWMREVLKDEYEEFESELVPKAREIVSNTNAGKDEKFFVDALTNVFTESYRVLKDDGELIFTYHHNENEAWSVILESLIKSGFTIAGAYPVQSEKSNSTHISDLDNAEYDILIFANKERASEQTTLSQLRQDLFFKLQDMIAEEQERHQNLSQADLGVILRGKCMYYYSKHYPNIYSDGEPVGIDEALDTVDSVIEQIVESTVNLPSSIDTLTQSYAAFLQRGWEDYDDLNKHLLAKNLNVSDLEDEKLVEGPRDKKEPVSADARIHYIESKLNKNGKGADTLLDIDKVQYLYHLYKSDQNTVEYLKEWKSDDLEELADFMAEVTNDDRYESVMEMGLSQF